MSLPRRPAVGGLLNRATSAASEDVIRALQLLASKRQKNEAKKQVQATVIAQPGRPSATSRSARNDSTEPLDSFPVPLVPSVPSQVTVEPSLDSEKLSIDIDNAPDSEIRPEPPVSKNITSESESYDTGDQYQHDVTRIATTSRGAPTPMISERLGQLQTGAVEVAIVKRTIPLPPPAPPILQVPQMPTTDAVRVAVTKRVISSAPTAPPVENYDLLQTSRAAPTFQNTPGPNVNLRKLLSALKDFKARHVMFKREVARMLQCSSSALDLLSDQVVRATRRAVEDSVQGTVRRVRRGEDAGKYIDAAVKPLSI